MIKSVKGLKVGQDFFYEGVKYIVRSFPDRISVIGKCTKILADYPLIIRVEICDIKRQPPMTIEERHLFGDMMNQLLKDPKITYYDLGRAYKSYFNIERYDPAKIIRVMAKVSGITIAEIKGTKRFHTYSFPRHLCFYHLWKMGAVLQDIGNQFSKKDHATVLYGRNKIAFWLKKNDKKTTELYEKFLIEMEKV